MNTLYRMIGLTTVVVLFTACSLTVTTDIKKTEPGTEVTEVTEVTEAVESSSAESADDVVAEPEAEVSEKVIEVTVRNWEFSPAAIMVKKGEKVTLKLVGESGVHGFSVPGLGLNVTVKPGEVTNVTLPTDTAGVYDLFCSIPCGPGHVDMQGTIVIEE